MNIRNLSPKDYTTIIRVIDEWWGGRKMVDMLPKLYFDHFHNTSFVVEEEDRLVAFLIGFISPVHQQQGYIHFVGIHPEYRRLGLGRRLYKHFFAFISAQNCTMVRCITSPINKNSILFHRSMGFQLLTGDVLRDGIPVHTDYDGLGNDRVVFQRELKTDEIST
ncbi:Ribosomal protein S18 acetylase RimI [Marininema mesophilum]|uniref:Ribosomal protein S18 acetylase RimI n=1 Tax=Marininema mesophilum TaxID=1048340 RepID=A0A1H3BBC9_9BACL|nr:GNAT family N-acetyltransferase [Marininema mesophilum]SDX38998.1 Ribosomal protein S18 acetylase RimI [Marininema mesophilum]